MEKKQLNLSRVKNIFEVGKISIFMSVFLSCLILLTVFGTPTSAAVKYPPGAMLQPGDITSTHIRNGTILNEDINASAAIAWTKLSKTGSSLADLETKAFSATTGTVGVDRGGTNKTSWTQYLIPYADTTTSFSQIAIGTSKQVLTSNGAGAAPTFQDVTINPFTPGTDTLKSAATERSTLNVAYTKLKDIDIPNNGGTLSVVFSLHGDTVNLAYGRIYVNDVAVGTERTRLQNTYEVFTEDINFSAGDNIQIYAHGTASGSAYVKDFYIYYKNYQAATVVTN